MSVGMVGTRVIQQDGGYVAVAVLSDGTLSTPMGASVRVTACDAEPDCLRILWEDSGPVVRWWEE